MRGMRFSAHRGRGSRSNQRVVTGGWRGGGGTHGSVGVRGAFVRVGCWEDTNWRTVLWPCAAAGRRPDHDSTAPRRNRGPREDQRGRVVRPVVQRGGAAGGGGQDHRQAAVVARWAGHGWTSRGTMAPLTHKRKRGNAWAEVHPLYTQTYPRQS